MSTCSLRLKSTYCFELYFRYCLHLCIVLIVLSSVAARRRSSSLHTMHDDGNWYGYDRWIVSTDSSSNDVFTCFLGWFWVSLSVWSLAFCVIRLRDCRWLKFVIEQFRFGSSFLIEHFPIVFDQIDGVHCLQGGWMAKYWIDWLTDVWRIDWSTDWLTDKLSKSLFTGRQAYWCWHDLPSFALSDLPRSQLSMMNPAILHKWISLSLYFSFPWIYDDEENDDDDNDDDDADDDNNNDN